MNVIPPLTITDARMTSSTVPEVAPAAYNAGTAYALNDTVSVSGSAGLQTVYKSLQSANTGHTPASSPLWWVSIGETYQSYSGASTYALGDMVINATTHLVYESLAASNTGNALTDTTKWLEVGPTNRWAMFDTLRNTATSVPSTLTIVLTPGERTDSIALLGLVADSVSISITSGGSPVYSYSASLVKRYVGDWYDYFFKTFARQPSFAKFDLPPYTDAVITVTLSVTTGNVSCGACVVGVAQYIGEVQYEAESDVLNFSSVTRDFAGGISSIVQRRNVPKTLQNILVEKSRVNAIRDLRDALAATPAVWAGLDDSTNDYFEAVLILGFYKRFSINLRDPVQASISLELEEI
ncbi:MAG: hypothetical protein V4451_15990 [Pseudomonadota bacterium]